jgi:two-component system nitrogen regulation sensor histidine kinase GlnL
MFNGDHLKQIIMNLVKNAMEAMENRGTIRLKTVYTKDPLPADAMEDLGHTSGHITIYVADDGPGIPGEIRQTIFQPQVTSKKRHQGLGLSIVKDLVSRMKGLIDVKSDQDQGTCFTIKLPVVEN